jgi:hypothetical protein
MGDFAISGWIPAFAGMEKSLSELKNNALSLALYHAGARELTTTFRISIFGFSVFIRE